MDLADLPPRLLVATLAATLSVLGTGIAWAARWLVAQDARRATRLDALEAAVRALDRAVDARAPAAHLSAMGDRLTAAQQASEAALRRELTTTTSEVAVLRAVLDERTRGRP